MVHAAVNGRLQCTTGGTCGGQLLASQQNCGVTGKPFISGVAVNVLNTIVTVIRSEVCHWNEVRTLSYDLHAAFTVIFSEVCQRNEI